MGLESGGGIKTGMGSYNLTKVDYTDDDGIKRRVLLPVGDHNVREGIPISLNLDTLYAHCPVEYRRILTDELWARGLIEPCDFMKPGADDLIRAAFLAAVRRDSLDIKNLAREACKP